MHSICLRGFWSVPHQFYAGGHETSVARDVSWHGQERGSRIFRLRCHIRRPACRRQEWATAGPDFCRLGPEMRISLDQNRVEELAHGFGLVVN